MDAAQHAPQSMNATAPVAPAAAGLSFGSLTLSPTFGRIYQALLSAQRKITATRKTGLNEDFDSAYPTLEDVIDALKAPLNDEGVIVLQPVTTHQNRVRVTTLMLLDNEYISAAMEMTARDASPHAIASTVTYAQRISLKSLMFLPAKDDDGNGGMRPEKPASRPSGAAPEAPDTAAISRPPAKPHETASPAMVQAPAALPEAASISSPIEPAPATETLPPATEEPVTPPRVKTTRAAKPQTLAPEPAPTAAPAPLTHLEWHAAPADLTDAERLQIQRLHSAVTEGTCSLEQARTSLSEGGVSFNRLRPHALTFARGYILGVEPRQEIAHIDATIGF